MKMGMNNIQLRSLERPLSKQQFESTGKLNCGLPGVMLIVTKIGNSNQTLLTIAAREKAHR